MGEDRGLYRGKRVDTGGSIEAGKMKLFAPRRINRNATYKCSVCGKLCSSYYNDVGEWKYCPHCGAKMEKEKA